MELITDCINIKKNISTTSSHFNITSDIIIPDSKPDIKKILECYKNTLIKDISFDNNKVTITGTITYTLLYYSPNYSLNSMFHTSKFSHEISLPNIPENSFFDASINIENSEYEILNEKRIIIKHIANTTLIHNEQAQINVLSDVEPNDNLELLKENISLPHYLGHNTEKLFFKENIEIEQSYPTIEQILKRNFNIKNISYKIVDNKILISGIFECNILYFSYDSKNNVKCYTFEKNLSQVINMPDITNDTMLDCSIAISDITLNTLENSDGEQRIIDCEAIFDIKISAYVYKNISHISDAYGFSDLINIEQESIQFNNIKDTLNENFYLKNTLELNSSLSDLTVHDVDTKILFSEYKIVDKQIIINGILNVCTLFQDDTDEENFKVLEQEYPFKHILETSYDIQSLSFKLNIQNIDYNINIENNLEFKINLNVTATIFCSESRNITTNISKTPIDNQNLNDKPSIIVYFTRESDSLWSIAKKYLTTVNNLKIANGITNDSISPNQQILIL